MNVKLQSGEIVPLQEYYKRMETDVLVNKSQLEDLRRFRDSARKSMGLPPFRKVRKDMNLSPVPKYSNCFWVSFRIWLKDPRHRHLHCKSCGILFPHFWVNTDTGYQIHFKAEDKVSGVRGSLRALWFKGRLKMRRVKRLKKKVDS